MVFSEPRERAAHAVVDRLRRDQLLEAPSPKAVAEDIEAVLKRHEERVGRVIRDVVSANDGSVSRLIAFERQATKAGILSGEAAIRKLRSEIVEALLASSNVEEIFAEDETLDRIVNAALLDYAAASEEVRLSALREGDEDAVSSSKREAPPGPPTFADAGYPFPLFEAPREEASIDEAGPCAVCRTSVDMRFEGACYACFRAGRVETSRDTELGVVDASSLETGLTMGIPAEIEVHPRGTEVVRDASDPDEELIQFRVDPAFLTELLRSPDYTTWQGESWLFCCARPMVFIGSVREKHLDAWSRETGRRTVDILTELLAPETIDAEAFIDRIERGSRVVYGFRCGVCAKRRAHWDSD